MKDKVITINITKDEQKQIRKINKGELPIEELDVILAKARARK